MLPEFSLDFHPVIKPEEGFEVLDFSLSREGRKSPRSSFTIGRYNEKRIGLYTHELFAGGRDNHIGIDLGGPAGTKVYAFYDGEIYDFREHAEPGDYGPTLITRHLLHGVEIYALYGHLSRDSLRGKRVGQDIRLGEILGKLGTEEENGGWPPHVHFQLSLLPPEDANMPGTVSDDELEKALKIYPDPRVVLGPLY
jgi:murein DD-endopeptidase MepM/ murein hydrolase activator NlpD